MIAEEAFLGCVWLFLGIAAITTVYQWKVRNDPLSARYDSILAAAGLLFLLAYTLVVTPLTLEFFHLTLLPMESARLHMNSRHLKLQLISAALNTVGLWLVKLGSLGALYPLIDGGRHLRMAWFSTWATLFIGWTLCMACDPITLGYSAMGCDTRFEISYIRLWIYTISDIVTSSLVMLLPLTMLWVAKTPTRQKIFPAARFSSTTIIVGLSSARLGMGYTGTFFTSLFWLHLFGSLECCVALTIYNGLITIQHRNRQVRRSQSIISGTSTIAQKSRAQHAPMATPALEEIKGATRHCSKPLPALSLNNSLLRSNVGPYSRQQDQFDVPRASHVHSAFSFSTFSED